MRKINWDYMGGWFDGEGSAWFWKSKLCKSRQRLMLFVDFPQKDKRILNDIHKFIKIGNIYSRIASRTTNLNYYLRISCKEARWFLNKVLPYCRDKVKIKQIQKALALDKKYVNPRKIK